MATLISLKPDPAALEAGLRARLGPDAGLFEGCDWAELSLRPDDASLRVTLRLARVAEEREPFEALQRLLLEQGARSVSLKVGYQPGSLTAPEYLALHFDDLALWLQHELDIAAGWLGGMAYDFDEPGGRLTLALASPLAERTLRERKAAALVAGLVEWACGEAREVVFKVDVALQAPAPPAPLAPPAPASPALPAGGAPAPREAVPPQKERLLLGRLPSAERVRPMASLREEELGVTVEGDCFAFEADTKKTGRTLVKMALSDGTDSLTAKVWLEPKAPLPKGLEKGARLRARGDLKPDQYENGELTLEARDLARLPSKPRRRDDAPDKRVELHAHTKMSASDGLTDVEAYITRAGEWGHSAVGVTDHGVVHAFPLAYKAAQAASKKRKEQGLPPLKLLLGMEAYLVEDAGFIKAAGKKAETPPYYHAILYARDEAGRRHLYELVSHSHIHTFYKKPLIPRALLKEKRSGLLLGSACEQGELIQAILRGEPDGALRTIASFYDYLEVQPLGNNAFMLKNGEVKDEEGLRAIVRKVIQLGAELGKPVVATSDMHFLDPEDELYRRVLQAGQGFSDAEAQPPLYFHTTEEMLKEFEWLEDPALARKLVVEDPQAVAALCQSVPPVPEGRYFPELPGAEDTVQAQAWARAKAIYGATLPEMVRERLERELKAIVGNKFAVLYEIARQLVEESQKKGYSVGSRGSVGSSLAAYLLGITEVNPLPAHERCPACGFIEFREGERLAGVDLPGRPCPSCKGALKRDGYNIPFETFVGFKGDKVPDIDLNFAPEVQTEIQKHAETLFGTGRAFKAGTISTLADKTAYGFVKKYYEGKGETRRKAEIERVKEGLVGVKRTSGQHPGGVILVREDRDINDFTPVQYSGDLNEQGGREKASEGQLYTTHFDYHAIDENLVKLDILGKDDGSAFKHLQDLTGLHEGAVPLDDPLALSIFSSQGALKLPKLSGEEKEVFGETGAVAIPEFGTGNTRRMLELTRPRNFTELIYISGLSHGTGVWAGNAEELIRAGTATLDTVISTRDDIMNRLIRQGMEPGLAFKITEKVRKGAVAREGFSAEEEAALKAVKLPQWWIESARKIQYMFPKAHATAYCFTAVRMAYFKVHHPAAFYAAWLTLHAADVEADTLASGREAVRERVRKLRQMRQDRSITPKDEAALGGLVVGLEAILRGVAFAKVDLYKSDPLRFTPVAGGLLPPLVALDGLGEAACEGIVRERALAPFKSIEDLAKRAGLNKTVIEKLQASGALDILPKANQIDLF